MQSNVAKKELKRQSKIKESTRASISVDAAEFIKNNKNGQWVDDVAVKKCMRCEKKFTVTIRKHHCRECGGIFCDSCSSRKLIINGQLKRACENCYESVVSGKNKSLGPVTFPTALSALDDTSKASFLDNMEDGSLSPRPSSLMKAVKSAESTSKVPQYPWVKSLLLIRSLGRNSTDRPEIDSCYPQELPAEMLDDIVHIAMPNELNKERESLEFNFTFRIDPNKYSTDDTTSTGERDSTSSSGSSKGNCDLLYGFVLYRQKQLYVGKDDARTSRPICQSLVMISEVPIPYLAYRFLTNLEEALFHVLSISSAMKQEKESTEEHDQSQLTAGSTDRSTVKEEVNRALQVGVNMISSWPAVELTETTPSLNLALPLLGEIVQFSVNLPCILPRSLCSIPDPFRFSKMSLGSSVTYSSGTNLISQFGPYGLLPHLWVLWELLVQGKNIVVLSHFADACSEMVMALSSLVISSSNHYRGGAVYPYISRHNKSEVHRIAVEAKNKKVQMEENDQSLRPDQSPSTIVGITDPSLLQDFRHFSVLIILSPKISEQEGERGGSSPSHVMKKSVALQKSIDSIHSISGNKTPLQKLADESIVKYNPKFASPLKTASDFEASATKESPVKVTKSKVGIFAKGFIHWKRSKDVSGANAPPAYVIVQAPSSSISFPKKLQERVCSRLQKLSRRDYLVLGDRILRDHFNEMSERIFEPLPMEEKLSITAKSTSTGETSKSAQDEDEYEEVEVEVDEDEGGFVGSATAVSVKSQSGPLSTLLKVLKSNHDSLQISTFKNFVGMLLGCTLLLMNRLLSFPPLWLVVLVLTAFFVSPTESFDKFVADKTAQASTSSTPISKKVKKTVRRKKAKTSSASAASSKTDYSGVWKRTKAVNFEAFAAAQGAGYVQRKLAASIEMIVTITMDAPHCTSVRIQEDGGPIHSDNTMVIGGEPSEALLGAKLYADSATWEGEILKITKVLKPSEEYSLEVYRYLEDNGQSMRQMQTFIDGKSGKRVECQTFFTRTGNSPNPPPASTFPPGQVAPSSDQENIATSSITSPVASTSDTKAEEPGPTAVDFSGVWSRFKSHNMDQYAGALGAGYLQRKMAGSIAMEHTITMNPPALNSFRLQEVGGPLKSDTLYTINATKPIEVKWGKALHNDVVEWKDSVTSGTLLEAMPSTGPTLVTTKTPIDGGDYTVYQGRYLEDPNTLVVVNIHYNHSTGDETRASNWFKLTGPSPNPAPEPTLPIKDGSTSDSGDVTSVRQERRSSTASLRVDFSGVWDRQADDSEKMMSTVMQSQGDVLKSTHEISMDSPALSSFQIIESSAKTNIERTYQIGGDFIETSLDDKVYKEKCFWLGDALVIQRLSLTNDVEITLTRFLENDRIRLVTVRKNLNTGDNTESVSFFTKRVEIN